MAAPLSAAEQAEAHHARGIELIRAHRLAEAVACFRLAITLRPDHAQAHNNLAGLLRALNHPNDAIAHYRQALAIEPDYAEGHGNLGVLLAEHKRYDEAIAHYHRALAINPALAAVHVNLGRAFAALERSEDALAAYDKALAITADAATVYADRGVELTALGRAEAARVAFQTAVALSPGTAEFHYLLANSKIFAAGDRQLAVMEQLAAALAARPAHEQLHLGFALAKAYEDLGAHDRCMGHLLRANRLKRQSIAYDEAAVLGELARIRASFGAALLARASSAGDPSPVPVFIVGMPRSGTTLVEQILASHPDVAGGGERSDLSDALAAVSGTDPAPADFPEGVASWDDTTLQRLGAGYLAALARGGARPLRITDKTPSNFALIGLIRLALPNARIIHVRRDAIDTCLSCFSKLFAGGTPFAYDLGELGRYYRAYDATMAHWRRVLPEGIMLELDYETLVGDLEATTRRMLDHCGLAWDAACLNFHETQRAVRTASALEVRRPVHRRAIGRWQVSPELLAPLLAGLNAPPPDAAAPTAPAE
jgi:tetratricopeptide (TPR) repeat protein